jgi:hypothetical protein
MTRPRIDKVILHGRGSPPSVLERYCCPRTGRPIAPRLNQLILSMNARRVRRRLPAGPAHDLQRKPMSETTHLLLPYLAAAQAQKHVTHNEALRLLDGLVQLAVLDRTAPRPPEAPPTATATSSAPAPPATGQAGT